MLNLLNWDEPMFFHWTFVEAILFTSSVLEQRHPWNLDTTQTQTWFLPALGSAGMTLLHMKEHLTFRVHFQSDAQDWLHLLSYERVKSLNILEDGMAPSLFRLLYVSAMQTHKGQSLKHEAFARSKGRSLPSQPLESLWTSVQKRMVWTSPLQSEIDLDWFCSRFASVVQVRATRKRFEVKDWKQRTGTSDKWQVHTSRRRRSWTGLLCCRLRHVLYVKGFDMEGLAG